VIGQFEYTNQQINIWIVIRTTMSTTKREDLTGTESFIVIQTMIPKLENIVHRVLKRNMCFQTNRSEGREKIYERKTNTSTKAADGKGTFQIYVVGH
jgi:hypothetical protein